MNTFDNDAPKLENADRSSLVVKQAIPATQPKGGIVQIQPDTDPLAQPLSERARQRKEAKYFGMNLVRLGMTIFSIPFTFVGIPYAIYQFINRDHFATVQMSVGGLTRQKANGGLMPLPVGIVGFSALLLAAGLVVMFIGLQDANRSTPDRKKNSSPT